MKDTWLAVAPIMVAACGGTSVIGVGNPVADELTDGGTLSDAVTERAADATPADPACEGGCLVPTVKSANMIGSYAYSLVPDGAGGVLFFGGYPGNNMTRVEAGGRVVASGPLGGSGFFAVGSDQMGGALGYVPVSGGTAFLSTSYLDGGDANLLAKLTVDGALSWAKAYAPEFSDSLDDFPILAAVDASGASYVVMATRYGDGFGYPYFQVSKLDAAGATVWTRQFGDHLDTGSVSLQTMGADPHGGIVLTGTIPSTIPAQSVPPLGERPGSFDFGGGALPPGICVVKLDASGSHVFSRTVGSGKPVVQETVVDSQGSVIVAGLLSSAEDFGGGPLYVHGAGQGDSSLTDDIFVLKLDNSGKHVFSRSFGDERSDKVFGLTVDSTDAVTVARASCETVPTSIVQDELTITRLDPTGAPLYGLGFLRLPSLCAAQIRTPPLRGQLMTAASPGTVSLAVQITGPVTLGGQQLAPATGNFGALVTTLEFPPLP
jgi:hypothetical protein